MLRLHTKEALMQTELGKQVDRAKYLKHHELVCSFLTDQKLLSSSGERDESI